MYPHVAHVFLDGGYLRALATERALPLFHPSDLAKGLLASSPIQTWAYNPMSQDNAFLGRITYYDALPDEGESNPLQGYWDAIELLDDVHLGFGALRGIRKRVRQKAVDTLIAVDMVGGAYSGIFDIALLVAGDADFVPVIEEVKRRGVMAAVAASARSISEYLRRAADRFIEIPDSSDWLRPMNHQGKTWPA